MHTYQEFLSIFIGETYINFHLWEGNNLYIYWFDPTKR